MEDGQDIEAKLEKWRKPVQFGLSILLLLVVYFAVLPAGIIFIVVRTEWFDNMPEWLEIPLEYLFFPIGWLYESVPMYEIFLDWLDSAFDR